MLYGHYLSYRVAHAPYSVFGASPLDTSDEEDLALLLLADAEEEATGQKKKNDMDTTALPNETYIGGNSILPSRT